MYVAQNITKQLLHCSGPVSGDLMLRRALGLLMTLVFLFGSVGAPAIAHSQGQIDAYAFEMIDADLHSGDCFDNESPSETDKAPHAGHHHHCTASLEAITPHVIAMMPATGVHGFPFGTSVLVSHKTSPPTEPPAA